jgi:DNA-binding transcriptional LysR family regulator
MTIVESGNFAAAARNLGRASSVVSYSVANLENQLGVQLFDRSISKKSQLTAAGHAVLAEARSVTNGGNGLRAKVKGLLQGLESEVHVALDVIMPANRVIDALRAFSEAYPTVTLRLYTEALGAATQMVLNGVAGVGVSGPLDVEVNGLERVAAGFVQLVPVAAPTHPLAIVGRNRPGAGREHVQLVLTDRSILTDGIEFAVISPRSWRLAGLGSKHMLLRDGIGWGNMPEPMVREDLRSGRLVRLDMPDFIGGPYRLQAIYRSDAPPGPAARFLIERFEQQGGEYPALPSLD